MQLHLETEACYVPVKKHKTSSVVSPEHACLTINLLILASLEIWISEEVPQTSNPASFFLNSSSSIHFIYFTL